MLCRQFPKQSQVKVSSYPFLHWPDDHIITYCSHFGSRLIRFRFAIVADAMPRQGATPNKIPRRSTGPPSGDASSAAASEPRRVGDSYLDPELEGVVVPGHRAKSPDSSVHSPGTPTTPTEESDVLVVRPAQTYLPENEGDMEFVYAVDGGTMPFNPVPGEYELPETPRDRNKHQSQAAPSQASSSSAALVYPTDGSHMRATSAPGAVGSEVSTRARRSDSVETEAYQREQMRAEQRRHEARMEMIRLMPSSMRMGHEKRELNDIAQDDEGAESTTTHTDAAIRPIEQALGGRPECKRGRPWQKKHRARAEEFENRPGQLPKAERIRLGILNKMIDRATHVAALRCGMTVQQYTSMHGQLSVEDAESQTRLAEDMLRVLGVTAGKTIKFHHPDHPWGFRIHCGLVAR